MPSSKPDHLNSLCQYIIDLNPQSILDVGMGFGSKGMLFREYTDIWNRRYHRNQWETIIDGVEIFAPYITDLQRLIYNTIYLSNILDIVNKLQSYDLIYLGDVLEHIEKYTALSLLDKLKTKGKHLLISVPNGYSPQGIVFGNPYEQHISEWGCDDFPDATQIHSFGNKLLIMITS